MTRKLFGMDGIRGVANMDPMTGEFASVMEPLPQVEYTVEVKEKKVLSEFPEIGKRIKEIEKSLGSSGRILIRYSGTEPLLRIVVEAEDETKLHPIAQDLVELVKKHIG